MEDKLEEAGMKPLKAYAIMDSNGKLAIWDHHVPIYWRRDIALQEKRQNCFADSKVVTVVVTLAGTNIMGEIV